MPKTSDFLIYSAFSFHFFSFRFCFAFVSLLFRFCFAFVSLLFRFCFAFVSLFRFASLFRFCFVFIAYFSFSLCPFISKEIFRISSLKTVHYPLVSVSSEFVYFLPTFDFSKTFIYD